MNDTSRKYYNNTKKLYNRKKYVKYFIVSWYEENFQY